MILVSFFTFLGCVGQEGRALWVVRYRLVDPKTVDQIVKDAKAAGFNLLFVQVYGRGDAYFNSSFVPRAEPLEDSPHGYDPLAYVISKAHEAGLQVHAWLNVYYVWPSPPPLPSSSDHLVRLHPEWLIKDEDGRTLMDYTPRERATEPVEGLFLDPSQPGVRRYFLKVCQEVLSRYPVGGIHLDFVRYPGSRWGFNEGAVEAFKKRWGVDPRFLSRWVRYPFPRRFLSHGFSPFMLWNYCYQSLWAEERSSYVSRLVEEVSELVKSRRPRVVLSAAVIADPDRAYYEKGQDWRRWLAEGWLDLVVPMAYQGDACRVEAQIREAIQCSGGERKVFAGLGAWRKSPEEIATEVARLRRIGVDGLSLFSYQGMKDFSPDYLEELRKYLTGKVSLGPKGPPLLDPFPSRGHPLIRSLQKQFFFLSEGFEALKERREEVLRQWGIISRITEEVYPRALPKEEEIVALPSGFDLKGIFVPAHPYDCPETKRKAFDAIMLAYERLRAGVRMGRVAKEVGGYVVTNHLFLGEGWDFFPYLVSLQEGDLTQALQLPHGYVVYQVMKRYPPEERRYGELPWSLKRVVFQQRFADLLRSWGK